MESKIPTQFLRTLFAISTCSKLQTIPSGRNLSDTCFLSQVESYVLGHFSNHRPALQESHLAQILVFSPLLLTKHLFRWTKGYIEERTQLWLPISHLFLQIQNEHALGDLPTYVNGLFLPTSHINSLLSTLLGSLQLGKGTEEEDLVNKHHPGIQNHLTLLIGTQTMRIQW